MHIMMYPEDIKEASRILKQFDPFGSKPWPLDANFVEGNFTSAIQNLVIQEWNSKDAYANTSPEHVTSILSKFWDHDTRQKLYDTVNEVYSIPKQELVQILGSRSILKDSSDRIFMKILWFEVSKMILEPAGKSEPKRIKELGQCLENLIPRKSTIPDAGFGGECTCGYSVSHENQGYCFLLKLATFQHLSSSPFTREKSLFPPPSCTSLTRKA
jgi:hypothetical protein